MNYNVNNGGNLSSNCFLFLLAYRVYCLYTNSTSVCYHPDTFCTCQTRQINLSAQFFKWLNKLYFSVPTNLGPVPKIRHFSENPARKPKSLIRNHNIYVLGWCWRINEWWCQIIWIAGPDVIFYCKCSAHYIPRNLAPFVLAWSTCRLLSWLSAVDPNLHILCIHKGNLYHSLKYLNSYMISSNWYRYLGIICVSLKLIGAYLTLDLRVSEFVYLFTVCERLSNRTY